MIGLAESYAHCRQVARSRARNFYYSFVLLRPEQRDAMCAVYAFMRYCDDLSDEPGANRASIDQWRGALDEALAGRTDAHPVLPAFHDAVTRFAIPSRYFYEMIEGVSSDLEPRQFETFDQLYRYCYLVASTVGLTIIHIFGYQSPEALPLAEKCGIAFQMTNILRDIREDAERGRIYLPSEDLRRFHVTSQDLVAGVRTPEFIALMDFQSQRARAYYQESQPLVQLVERRSQASLGALITIYSRLLAKIERSNYDVFSHRISLSAFEKSLIVLRAFLK